MSQHLTSVLMELRALVRALGMTDFSFLQKSVSFNVSCQRRGNEYPCALEEKGRDGPRRPMDLRGNEDQPLYDEHKSRSSIPRSLEPVNQHLED